MGAAVSERASNLLGGICGLAAVALLIGGFPFTGATPSRVRPPTTSRSTSADRVLRRGQGSTSSSSDSRYSSSSSAVSGRSFARPKAPGGWIATTALGAALAALTCCS